MILPANENFLRYAINLAQKDKAFVYPTDTLYGMGCSAKSSGAIRSVNRLKGRTQAMSIILYSLEQIPEYCDVDDDVMAILEGLFPGPYTCLLRRKECDLVPEVWDKSELLGVRIPKHPFPLTLVKELGFPVTTTSVNRHGTKPNTDVHEIEIDYPGLTIFEDSDMEGKAASTIIDFSTDEHRIVRQGAGVFPLE